MRALEQKINSGTHVGGKTMRHFTSREREENFKVMEEARVEQENLRKTKRARIGFRRGYRPYVNFRKS